MTPIKDKIEELYTDRPPGKIYLIMNYQLMEQLLPITQEQP